MSAEWITKKIMKTLVNLWPFLYCHMRLTLVLLSEASQQVLDWLKPWNHSSTQRLCLMLFSRSWHANQLHHLLHCDTATSVGVRHWGPKTMVIGYWPMGMWLESIVCVLVTTTLVDQSLTQSYKKHTFYSFLFLPGKYLWSTSCCFEVLQAVVALALPLVTSSLWTFPSQLLLRRDVHELLCCSMVHEMGFYTAAYNAVFTKRRSSFRCIKVHEA